MANILKDLPSGAPLGRLALNVYRGVFGKYEDSGFWDPLSSIQLCNAGSNISRSKWRKREGL